TAVEGAVVSVRLSGLPVEDDRVGALDRVAADLVVPGRRCRLVVRIDDLLPGVREVRGGDRDLLAAPVPDRVRADRNRQVRLRRGDGRRDVKMILALVVDDVRAANGG